MEVIVLTEDEGAVTAECEPPSMVLEVAGKTRSFVWKYFDKDTAKPCTKGRRVPTQSYMQGPQGENIKQDSQQVSVW